MGNGFLSPHKALAFLGFFAWFLLVFLLLRYLETFWLQAAHPPTPTPPHRDSSPSRFVATALTYRQTADKTDHRSQQLLVPPDSHTKRTRRQKRGNKGGTGVFVSFRQLHLTIMSSYDHYVCASSGIPPFKMTVSQHAVRRVTVVNYDAKRQDNVYQHDTSGAPEAGGRGLHSEVWHPRRAGGQWAECKTLWAKTTVGFFVFLLVCCNFSLQSVE